RHRRPGGRDRGGRSLRPPRRRRHPRRGRRPGSVHREAGRPRPPRAGEGARLHPEDRRLRADRQPRPQRRPPRPGERARAALPGPEGRGGEGMILAVSWHDLLLRSVVAFNEFVIFYFLCLNTVYLILFLVSLWEVVRFVRRTFFSDYQQILKSE